jgi:glycosyltransferase involved in cell wall biosynthesis
MKLLVDARCLQDKHFVRRGIGRNTEGILRHARRFLPLQVVALLDPAMNDLPDDIRPLFDSVERQILPPSPSEGPAMFFNPSPMTHPPARLLPLLGREHILSCAIYLDSVPLDDPEYYLDNLKRRMDYLACMAALRQYRLFAPISRYAADDIHQRYGIARDAMVVGGAVLPQHFASLDPARQIDHPSICRFRPGTYFIMVGGGDRRKNAHSVLEAVAILARQGRRVPLVIVGNYSREMIEDFLHRQRRLGGHPGDVQFLHGIDDAVLAALYKHSLACICPSKSEGFSMPVIEAMACRAPVLASNCPAQVELVEQQEALFDPDDVDAIAALIEQAVEQPEWLNHLRQAQASLPRRFTEEEVAARIWMHVRRHLPAPSVPAPAPRSRPRLGFLCPYPPSDSMTVGYLPTVLRELAAHAYITIFTAERKPRRDPWLTDVQPLSAMAHATGEFDRLVTVLGLEGDMRRYFWLAERYGGTCLLFQSQLAAFYLEVFGPQRTRDVAEKSLGREVTLGELHHWAANPHDAGNRILAEVGRWADPLIVHSRLVCRDVEPSTPGRVEWLAPCLLSAPDESELTADHRAAARARLGLDARAIHLLHLDNPEPALLPAMVHACEQLRAWGIEAQLHFVGNMARETTRRIGEIAAGIGLADDVTISGDGSRRDWLAAADLGISLCRAGSTGVPHTLYEMLASGLPTVANREIVQGLALLSLALEVPDVPSALLIAEQWRLALDAGRHRDRFTDERRRFVEERQPSRYAKALLHLMNMA